MISAHRRRMPVMAPTTAQRPTGSGDSFRPDAQDARHVLRVEHHDQEAPPCTRAAGPRATAAPPTDEPRPGPILPPSASVRPSSPCDAALVKKGKPTPPRPREGQRRARTGPGPGGTERPRSAGGRLGLRQRRSGPEPRSASPTTESARSLRNGLTSMRSTPCSRSRSGSRRCPQPVMSTTGVRGWSA